MLRPVLLGLLLAAVSASNALAQSLIDTAHIGLRLDSTYFIAPGIPNGPQLSFDHLLSIYEWRGQFNYFTRETPFAAFTNSKGIDTVQFDGDSRFLQDNVITTTSATGYVYADDPVGGGSFRPLLALYGSSYITGGAASLVRAALISKQVDGFGAAGLRYMLTGTDLDFSAAGGLAQETQAAISTLGSIIRGTFNAPAEIVSENTVLSASALADERFFHDRAERYSNDRASMAAVSSVGSPTTLDSNHAYLDAGLERRDFFFSTDSSGVPVKQERTELSLSLRDSLNYPIVPNALTGTLDAEFDPSSITRRSDIASSTLASSSFSAVSSLLVPNEVSQLRLALGGRLDLAASPVWSAQARMSYDERTENVRLLSNELAGVDPSLITKFSGILDEASYSARTTLAGLVLRYLPSLREEIQLEGDAHLLNYDTPSELNNDDHDELIMSASARYDRFFSDRLNGGFELRAARTHLVYLKSDRSAQNQVTRAIAFTTHANYVTSTLLAEASGEVFANYTVLDYLDSVPILQGIGNYLLRGLALSDSVLLPVGIYPFYGAGSFTLEEGATLRVSERGSYDVPSFSEVLDTRITELSVSLLVGLASYGIGTPVYDQRTARLEVARDASSTWSIRAGVRGFVLSRSGHSTTSLGSGQFFEELERQTRLGPILTVSLLRWFGMGPTLNGSIWYDVIKDQNFDIPAVTRTPQLESHLSVQWTF